MRSLDSTKQLLRSLLQLSSGLPELQSGLQDLKMLAAAPLVKEVQSDQLYASIQEAEFKVFSQFGDDGIIQYLVGKTDIDLNSQRFIEFGVENYCESNTRFLLMNNNWSGLVMDGSQENVEFIKNDPLYWKHDLTAVNSFIDKNNINTLIADHGFAGELGLLSIDIDGNDYWVWEAIDVVDPAIVIVEYNSVFGSKRAVTVPYDPSFNCTKAHHSNLFWGCSLKALYLLAERKGYSFIGTDSRGNNAYFVNRKKLGNLRPLSVDEGYVCSKFRESRDETGRLTYASGRKRLELIKHMQVMDIQTGLLIKVAELLD